MERPTLTALISVQHEAGFTFTDRHFASINGNELHRVMIEKLQSLELVDSIVINTDSSDIARGFGRSRKCRIVNAYTATPAEIEIELTSDKVTAAMIEETEGSHFLQLGPVFPFLKSSTIESVIEAYYSNVIEEDARYDSVLTIRAINRRLFDSDNDLVREDRPNTFVEDGILHVFNRETFLANGGRKAGKRPYGYIVNEIENMAVDSEENYQLARLVYDNRHFFPGAFR
jgi:CMP-N-acetylneuraminic acid synthetase